MENYRHNQPTTRRKGSPMWSPFQLPFDPVSNFLENFWEDGMDTLPQKNESFVTPNYSLKETDEAFLLSMDLPGVDEKDIQIEVDHNVLSIKGERKFEEETKDEKVHKRSSFFGSFQRSFQLPDYINDEKVEARFANGVLSLTIPKQNGSKKKQTIKIKS